jgi:hypothetical protein
MSRYKERYYAPEGWDFKNNFLVGTEWSVAGSKAGSSYVVALTPKGFKCDCTGFTFHGKCKHTTQIAERFDCETAQ